MKFKYTASDSKGKMIEGIADAQNSAEVLEYLANQGFRPISLKLLKEEATSTTNILLGQGINTADKVFLTKYLALMLKVGTDLFKAIDILMNDFEKPSMKNFLGEIKDNLERGQPFYTAFAKHPKYFSSVFVNLVKAGESSGSLERVFSNLSDSLKREQDLKNQIKGAITYPAILITVAFFIIVFLITFALPKIAGVFMSSGVEPPLFSKVVFAIGLFLNKYLWICLIAFLGIVAFLAYFFLMTPTGKKLLYQTFSKVPIIGKVMQQIAIQRFASTFSSLLKAGLPILEAMEITAKAVGSEDLQASLLRVANEGIAKGLTIGEAFRREAVFPRVVVNLIAISEKAGHIEDILTTLADFYESEIQSSVKSMMTFIEPVLLLGIGVAIGSIALAVIIPVYQLVGQF